MLLAATGMYAQHNEWLDPQTNAVNRAPMHTSYFAYADSDEAAEGVKDRSSNYLSINGVWKFNWVRDAGQRPMDFFRTDFNDKGWGDMPVPGIWELSTFRKQPRGFIPQGNHCSSRMVRKRDFRPFRKRDIQYLPVGERKVRRL